MTPFTKLGDCYSTDKRSKTPINKGRLKPNALIRVWKGEKATDVAPTPDDSQHIPYYETLTIEAVGDATNGKNNIYG